MTSKWGGAAAVAITATVSACGLFMLSGTAPATGNPRADQGTTVTTATHTTTTPDTANSTSVPAMTSPTTSDPTATTTPTTTTTTPITTTTTPITTTTTPITTTTTPITTTTTTTTVAPSPVPPSVTASSTVVGVGGSVTFEGSCAVGAPAAPIVVWITRESDGSTEVVDTGLARSSWTYTWTAPSDERDAASFVFRFWCGDPGDDASDYPVNRQARVDMVASAVPTPPPERPASVEPELPETN